MLSQYKELIREQDSRIVQISQANIYLQQELVKAKQLTEDMAINVQTLQDQNSLLKAQNNTTNVITTVPNTNGLSSQSDHTRYEKYLSIYFTRKYLLCGYILGVLPHTTTWEQLWGDEQTKFQFEIAYYIGKLYLKGGDQTCIRINNSKIPFITVLSIPT